jgi:predicted alpha/beta hydrolase family esterase
MASPMHRSARLMVIPGLHDSGPTHWQSWLQAQHRGAVRVEQDDWHSADLEAWAARIDHTLARVGPGPWIAVAHSFGCLALARHLALQPASGIAAALFVAPAEPDTFGVASRLPQTELSVPSAVVASDTDPWMTAAATRRWARRWGSHWLCLGDAGHINAESGFGPLPFARRWVSAMSQRLAREQRSAHASIREWTFAV